MGPATAEKETVASAWSIRAASCRSSTILRDVKSEPSLHCSLKIPRPSTSHTLCADRQALQGELQCLPNNEALCGSFVQTNLATLQKKSEFVAFINPIEKCLGPQAMQLNPLARPAPLTIAAQRSRGRRRYTRLSLISARRGPALTTKSKSPLFPSCRVDVEAETRMEH